MDGDFASKLQNVLSNPEALSKISAIASSLGGTSPPEALPQPEQKQEPPLPLNLPTPDPRLALLSSLKPLLREEKRDRIDSLVNALTVASMLKNFRK